MSGYMTSGKRSVLKKMPDRIHIGSITRCCGEKGKDAVGALSKALAKGDEKMRPLAAQALGEIGPAAKAARAELIAALLDELPGVRAAAARALGRTGALDDKAKAALPKATEDADDGVSFAAAEALQAAK
jgi:HEAT repeat protein